MHDTRDAVALLKVLHGLPRGWIARMKRDRMVTDYVLKAYIPAAGGTSSDVRF